MLILTHTAAGAAIGALIPDGPVDNVVGLTLGVASHYLLDKVPHWENWLGKEVEGFPSGTPLKQLPKITLISLFLDGFLAIGFLVFVMSFIGEAGPFWKSTIFWAASGAVLPDIVDNAPVIREITIKLPFVSRSRAFHERNHIAKGQVKKYGYWTGLFSQLIVITMAVWILFGR